MQVNRDCVDKIFLIYSLFIKVNLLFLFFPQFKLFIVDVRFSYHLSILKLLYHSHKKGKDSLETRAVFSWILILTWNFGGGRSGSASTLESASWFWLYLNYNWLFYLLHSENIISTSVSEAVQKIPTDEKDYRRCSFMCFTLHSHSIQRADQHIIAS